MRNIFVGNLSFTATKEDVRKLFETFGMVASVVMVKGKKEKPRGFCFVDMPDEAHLKAALAGLDGKEFMGRPLKISRVRSTTKSEDSPNNFKPVPKPWQKDTRPEFKPYRRDDGESKPWDKSKGVSKPFNKFRGQSPSKPWVKKENGPRPYRRDDGESKPRDKSKGISKPFYKFKGQSPSRPWVKKENGPRPYRRNDRESKPRDKNRDSS